eukprot:GHVR01141654.1.p1 GENE.GHVR01141654.1~~GHVR01141654.1.p1  ORF type:complete len:551 (+),score=146.26 GHVR01141654.1:56-1708(+)
MTMKRQTSPPKSPKSKHCKHTNDYTNNNTNNILYFCMEWGIEDVRDGPLQLYCGGLGILAGDIIKTVKDKSLPIYGVGILWGKGFSKQEKTGCPLLDKTLVDRTLIDPVCVNNTPVTVVVTVEGEPVSLRAFTPKCNNRLYLLEPISPQHRWMTDLLYQGDNRVRLAQKIILGVGGIRLSECMNLKISLYHFNEGHPVIASLELIRREIINLLHTHTHTHTLDRQQLFHSALNNVKKKIVFTTHTPIAAGNAYFTLEEFFTTSAALNFTPKELYELGKPVSSHTDGEELKMGFDIDVNSRGLTIGMTELALRVCKAANAVSEKHADTARKMWGSLSGIPRIQAITNGVHRPTWQDDRIAHAFATGGNLLDAHKLAKHEMLEEVNKRLPAHALLCVDEWLDCLVVGFGRRAALYKRAYLLLQDIEWMKMALKKKIRFIFSGKPHPNDDEGHDMVKTFYRVRDELPGGFVYVPDYDMHIGKVLTRGVDVWLNTPRVPMEASGTSGMKAAMNGVLNVSCLDGWWPEGCIDGITGWGIEETHTHTHTHKASKII